MSDSIIPSDLKELILREIDYCEKTAKKRYNRSDELGEKNVLLSLINLSEGNLYMEIKASFRIINQLADSINGLAAVIEKLPNRHEFDNIREELNVQRVKIQSTLDPLKKEIEKSKEQEKEEVISMDSTAYMKLAAFQELKEALQVKRVNDELLEYLSSSLNWLLHYSNKYQMSLPEKDRIIEMLENIMDVNKKLPLNFKHPSTTPEDSTEPKNVKENHKIQKSVMEL